MSGDPFGFRAMFEAQCALMELQILLRQQENESRAQLQREEAARAQAQFEELCRQHDAMDPNIIDLGPDDVREIKNVPLLNGITKDL